MIECIHKSRRRNTFSYRRMPSISCSCPLPPRSVGASWLASQQSVERGGSGSVEEPAVNTASAKWRRRTCGTKPVTACTPDMMWSEGHLPGLRLENLEPRANRGETSDKPKMRDSRQNTWPALLRTVKVMTQKKSWGALTDPRRLRKCDNHMECVIRGQNKDMSRKTREIWIKSGFSF